MEQVDASGHVFRYAADEEGRIATLQEVAQWRDGDDPSVGREPNFFEILQAIIYTDSLGGHTGFTGDTLDGRRDAVRNLQILQIGANIIDQWDNDDVPTTVRHPLFDPDAPFQVDSTPLHQLEIYGVENLPYLHQLSLYLHSPEYDRDLFQLWGIFSVWNPHQNALSEGPLEGVYGFRIAADAQRSGQMERLWHYYAIHMQHGSDHYFEDDYAGDRGLTLRVSTSLREDGESIQDLNAGRGRHLVFDPGPEYAEVVTLGREEFPPRYVVHGGTPGLDDIDADAEYPIGLGPQSPNDIPGLLFWEYDLKEHYNLSHGGLVPPKFDDVGNPLRPIEIQVALNALMEDFHFSMDNSGQFEWVQEMKPYYFRYVDDGGQSKGEGPNLDQTASHASILIDEAAGGERAYRLQAHPENPSPSVSDIEFWLVEEGETPPPGGSEFSRFWETRLVAGGSEVQVWARYAPKAGNRVHRLEPARHDRDLSATEPFSVGWMPDFSWETYPTINFNLQAAIVPNPDPDNPSHWLTYQRIDDWFRRYGSGPSAIRNSFRMPFNDEEAFFRYAHGETPNTEHHGLTHWREMNEGDEESFASFYHWMPTWHTMRTDPRGQRFGWPRVYHGRTDPLGSPLRAVLEPARNTTPNHEDRIVMRQSTDVLEALGFDLRWSHARKHFEGLVTNNPDDLNQFHPMRYADADGVVRPADAYFGHDPTDDNLDAYQTGGDDPFNLPTIPGRYEERPVILNRPFRSVGELGYVFRDLPWKSVDFFSRKSADLGLLDVFSLDDTMAFPPLTRTKVNLNTVRPEVLEALLEGTTQQLAYDDHEEIEGKILTRGEGDEIQTFVDRMIEEVQSDQMPFTTRGDIIPRVMDRQLANGQRDYLWPETVIKAEREAAVRTLGEIGSTRTWNFMIDLVVQSGRFTAASQTAADFLVDGEQRYWVHVSIDRITGEVVAMRTERVHR